MISLPYKGTFAYDAFLKYLRSKYGIAPKEIDRVKIEDDELQIIMVESKRIKLPLQEAYIYMQRGSLICTDSTGVWSDISAGFQK